jgi:hypothetical protein
MNICKSVRVEHYAGHREGEVEFDRCAMIQAALMFLWKAIRYRKIHVHVYDPPLRVPENGALYRCDFERELTPEGYTLSGNTWTTRYGPEANLWEHSA